MIYSLRLTLNDDEMVKSFVNHYPCVLVCKENPDTECSKDHYHCLIKTEIKLSTFRARLKVHFGKDFAGNKHYSIKSIEDDSKAIRYLCKGQSKTKAPFILINTYGVDTDDQHDEYWDQNEKIKHEMKEKPKDACIQYITDKYSQSPKPTFDELLDGAPRPKKQYKDIHGFPSDIVPRTVICDDMVEWYATRGYPLPHKTTGTMIVHQCIYNIYPPYLRTTFLREYYGISTLHAQA